MSTTIYHGLRITPRSRRTVFDISADIRQVLTDAAQQYALETTTEAMRESLYKGMGESVTYRTLKLALVTRSDDEYDDAGFGMTVFQSPDSNHLLAIPHGMNSQMESLRDRLVSLPEVEHWPYWNNTDKPEDVTEEEWEHREQAWKAVGWGPVCDYGLTLQLSDYDNSARSRRISFTRDDWETAWAAALADQMTLVKKAANHQIWQQLVATYPDEVGAAIRSCLVTTMDKLTSATRQLLKDHPESVHVPNYLTDLIHSEEIIEQVRITPPDGWLESAAEDVLTPED